MACIANASSAFCSVSALLVLLFIIPKSALSQGQIIDICNNTIDPSFCAWFLQSDPRFASADLRTLAQLTIDIAHSRASDGENYLNSLLQSTTDPSLQERLSSCALNYDDAVCDFKDAQGFLSFKDYGGINQAVSAAETEAGTCENDSQGTPPPPPELSWKNRELVCISSIILEISNQLQPIYEAMELYP